MKIMIMSTGLSSNQFVSLVIFNFSNWISPAMIIKLAEQLKDDGEEKTENVYEEIVPKERNLGRSTSSFDMDRNQLLAKRLTDLDMAKEKITLTEEDEVKKMSKQTLKSPIPG